MENSSNLFVCLFVCFSKSLFRDVGEEFPASAATNPTQVDRTFSVLFAEIWPIALNYAKYAVVRTIVIRPMIRYFFGPIFRFLAKAFFPLGVERFILFKKIPFPLISLVQGVIYRKFEHLLFKGVTSAYSYMSSSLFIRRSLRYVPRKK